ncbi:hypothetical protein C0J52_17032, partial [Blattella germanica]
LILCSLQLLGRQVKIIYFSTAVFTLANLFLNCSIISSPSFFSICTLKIFVFSALSTEADFLREYDLMRDNFDLEMGDSPNGVRIVFNVLFANRLIRLCFQFVNSNAATYANSIT